MSLFKNGFECFWGKRLFGMDRHGHEVVMPRVVEIVMAPPHMDKGKSGTLEGF